MSLFHIKGKIENIGHSWEHQWQYICIFDTNGGFKIYSENNLECIFQLEGLYGGIGKFQDKKVYLFRNYETYLIDLSDFKGSQVDFQFDDSNVNGVIGTLSNAGTRFLVYSKDGTQIFWKINFKRGNKYHLGANTFYCTEFLNNKILHSVSLINGKIHWSFKCSILSTWIDYDKTIKEKSITHLMGVWDNILWVNIDDGSFLLLEADTGKYIQNPSNTEIGFYGNPSQSFIDVDNGIVYGIFLTHLSILDIHKVKATQYDLKEKFSKHNIEARRAAVKMDKWLVFADDLNNKVAALNLETHELDWIWDLPQDDISPNERARSPLEIKGNDNKLYVKDNKNTLHVFEKN